MIEIMHICSKCGATEKTAKNMTIPSKWTKVTITVNYPRNLAAPYRSGEQDSEDYTLCSSCALPIVQIVTTKETKEQSKEELLLEAIRDLVETTAEEVARDIVDNG